MKKYYKLLDIYALILLGAFFSWHIFNGSLGIMAGRHYKQNIQTLKKERQKLLARQQKLNNDINCINVEINLDYLECLAMKDWKRVDPKVKILKVLS